MEIIISYYLLSTFLLFRYIFRFKRVLLKHINWSNCFKTCLSHDNESIQGKCFSFVLYFFTFVATKLASFAMYFSLFSP